MENKEIIQIFQKHVSKTAGEKKYTLDLSIEDQEAVLNTFEAVLNEDISDGQSIVDSLKGDI